MDLKNYIDKYADKNNRRKNLICLSELGRKTSSSSRELLNEWHNTVMDGITEDEFKLFKEVLQKMTASARSVIESTKI